MSLATVPKAMERNIALVYLKREYWERFRRLKDHDFHVISNELKSEKLRVQLPRYPF